MKIRMKVAMTGTRNGEVWPPAGGTIDLPEDEALGLVQADLAEVVAKQPEDRVEKAVDSEPVETRDEKPKRGPGRPRKNPTKE